MSRYVTANASRVRPSPGHDRPRAILSLSSFFSLWRLPCRLSVVSRVILYEILRVRNWHSLDDNRRYICSCRSQEN